MKYTIEAKPYGSYDVVICGGGTAGVCAAIASAREGAKTLLIERSFTVGGMLTVGDAGITKFSEHCKDVDKYKSEVLDVLGTEPKRVQVVGGIAHEFGLRMIKDGNALGTHGEAGSYIFTDKAAAQLTLIEMLDEAGVEVLYDTRVCLVNKDGENIKSVVVLNKEGFCEIDAKQFIDTTGDADVAALSGVPCNVGATEEDVAGGCGKRVGEMMNYGSMFRVRNVDFGKLFEFLEEHPERYHQHEFGVMSLENAKQSYQNGEMCVFRIRLGEWSPNPKTDLVQIYNLPEKDEAILLGPGCGSVGSNGLDARNLSRAQHTLQKGIYNLTEHIKSFPGFENTVVTYIPDVGVRETRHIVGEYTANLIDVLSGKDFEDSVACGGHPIDIHPIPKEVENADLNHWRFHIPYRVMLPTNVSNLLVAGRCVSATRIAFGAIRPTAQCMALGEAAGTAAAMAAKGGTSAKSVDVQTLRKKLTENGAII